MTVSAGLLRQVAVLGMPANALIGVFHAANLTDTSKHHNLLTQGIQKIPGASGGVGDRDSLLWL